MEKNKKYFHGGVPKKKLKPQKNHFLTPVARQETQANMKTTREISLEITEFIEQMWKSMLNTGENENKDTLRLSVKVNQKIKDLLNTICEHYNNRNDKYYIEWDIDEYHSYSNKNDYNIYFTISESYNEITDEFDAFEIDDDEVIA